MTCAPWSAAFLAYSTCLSIIFSFVPAQVACKSAPRTIRAITHSPKLNNAVLLTIERYGTPESLASQVDYSRRAHRKMRPYKDVCYRGGHIGPPVSFIQ